MNLEWALAGAFALGLLIGLLSSPALALLFRASQPETAPPPIRPLDSPEEAHRREIYAGAATDFIAAGSLRARAPMLAAAYQSGELSHDEVWNIVLDRFLRYDGWGPAVLDIRDGELYVPARLNLTEESHVDPNA